MSNEQKIAERLKNNIRLSSDNVSMVDCFWLCANKQYIKDLETFDHQVIWGRRGTGKTTILKAFVYNINELKCNPEKVALYIMMAKIIPTKEELDVLKSDKNGLSVYIFSWLILEMCDQLEKIYDQRKSVLEEKQENDFLEAYDALVDCITLYQAHIRGGELTIDNGVVQETQNEKNKNIGVGFSPIFKFLNGSFEFLKKNKKIITESKKYAISGKVGFSLETLKIGKLLGKMLFSLGIEKTYICLDEYSEIDKLCEFSIQSSVAQLIKQVFFKNDSFSVKIASIWNKSKLHSRGGNRIEGIEYKQDIFPGPDLDIMFLDDNTTIITYFKELLVNTYFMDESCDDRTREAMSECITNQIMGKSGLRHLICGSQGISRDFVILIKEYLQEYLKNPKEPVKLGTVYNIIKNQYLEDVRNKIPYYTIYRVINMFVGEKLSRYFLIKRADYHRCESIIKYLSTRGVFMQLPGHHTNRKIRDDYKLFIINYGNYLDALENSVSYRKGRKTLEEDAELRENGLLLPDLASSIIDNPSDYVIELPSDAENEVYCLECKEFFHIQKNSEKLICPKCSKEITRFSEFVDEVSI